MRDIISNEKRRLIWSNYNSGMSPNDLSKVFNVKINSIYTMLRRMKQNKSIEKRKTIRKTLPMKITPDIKKEIYTVMDENSASTYISIQRHILTRFQVNLHISTIAKCLKSMLFTTKNMSCFPVERNSVRVKLLRKEYCVADLHDTNKGEEIFIDECGFNFHQHRSRGRSLMGTPAYQIVPTQKGTNISLIAAMSSGGIIHKRVLKGSVNKDTFENFLQEVGALVGSDTAATFIFDNCRCHFQVQTCFSNHKTERIPPYSPFLNPIEELFSNVKRSVRTHISENLEEICHLTGQAKDNWLFGKIENECNSISSESCDMWVKHRKTFYPECILMSDVL